MAAVAQRRKAGACEVFKPRNLPPESPMLSSHGRQPCLESHLLMRPGLLVQGGVSWG